MSVRLKYEYRAVSNLSGLGLDHGRHLLVADADLVQAGAGAGRHRGGAQLSEGLPNVLEKRNEIEKLTINIMRSADSIVFFNQINSLNELFVKGEEIIFAHWDGVDFMKAPSSKCTFQLSEYFGKNKFQKTFNICVNLI